MRLTKIVSGLVGPAAHRRRHARLDQQHDWPTARPRPSTTSRPSAKEIGTSNKFKTFGKVPTYAGKKITIQRKVNKGSYTIWKKTKTKAGSGKFSAPIYGGKRGSKICYKIVVPKTKNYKATKKVVGCITTY